MIRIAIDGCVATKHVMMRVAPQVTTCGAYLFWRVTFFVSHWSFAMSMRILICWPLLTWLVASAAAQDLTPPERLFLERTYPQFRTVQCHLCHNDNGVASDYSIVFPSATASPDQVLAFGYSLAEFVDRSAPEKSALLMKPTGRVEHTGGVRIKPDSVEAESLMMWINHLASLSAEQQSRADRLIEQARKWQREPLSLQRLTHSQYNHTVRDLLGDSSQPANQFPKEDFIRGFKNQLEGQGLSPLLAEAYSQAAERLARAAFRGGDTQQLLPVQPTNDVDESAASAFVQQFGLKTFRRPLNEAERAKYTQLLLNAARLAKSESNKSGSTDVAPPSKSDTSAFTAGAGLVIEAMLQSPHFLYRRGATLDNNYERQHQRQRFRC